MSKSLKSKEEVQKAFKQLLAQYEVQQKAILTKEESARLEREAALLEETEGLSPQGIIKKIADLQWEVASTTENLRERVLAEVDQLEKMRTALKVQEKNLEARYQTKIAANALFILQQEQKQRAEELEEEHKEALETLQAEMQEQRADWEQEIVDFQEEQAENKAQLEKMREQELEEYRYQLERRYLREKDAFEMRKTQLLRKLDEEEREKQKDWDQRLKWLNEKAEEFKEHKEKVDGFEAELEEEVKKAKDKSFKEANRDAKEAQELYEKEMESKRKIAELQIESLSNRLENQKSEIEKLKAELKESVAQMQALSIKALENKQAS